MIKSLIALTLTLVSIANAATTVNQYTQAGTAYTRWQILETDTPANLIASLPSEFSYIAGIATTDSASITTVQASVLAKLTAAETTMPNAQITVTCIRKGLSSASVTPICTVTATL